VTSWILTGLSGAGKATALASLESAGVETVDNLPVDLIDGFVAVPRTRPAVAVVDARQRDGLARFTGAAGVRIVFLDARNDVLVRRIGESTRPHPCADAGRGPAAVDAERAVLQPMRAAADVVIDTSELGAADLQRRMRELIAPDGDATASLAITVSSFGYKYGVPADADWVVDSRMIRNPFWDPTLRPRTGLDAEVREYVLADPRAQDLLRRLRDLFAWAANATAQHGRRYLHVAIGCTGGRHRSVVLAEALAGELQNDDLRVAVRHRDVEKPDPR
jgi:RNase adapter protein RapZ